MGTFHRMTIINWAQGDAPLNDASLNGINVPDDVARADAPLGTAMNPGVIDVPDWLISNEPLEEGPIMKAMREAAGKA